ncbi:histidinol dehydrogenase [Filimonas lacunae]|uniref:Histidinol dehydrogenase n=1 Tax=Filimonas lacunae TaxID=477680 RepID=A0A173MKJ2_9BACT|nr:histidinol dehydrogenase [Filimonas lacunae]BAV08165.1 histidinol dehydrogenase [Filimonas lacunae]SIT10222.1 histidinol dehydrogenase [Filimonas lacunae]
MQVYINPAKQTRTALLQRPAIDATALQEKVKQVLNDVQQQGNAALQKYTQLFDGVTLDNFQVSDAEMKEAVQTVSDELKQAIDIAIANITTFHQKQVAAPELIQTMPGVQCWRKSVGIEKVGLYIPGGTAPLFSTILMLAIPARIAGCKEIILCSPPGKNGLLHPAILYAAFKTGVTRIYKLGGVQAIAAMAYGTETVPQVYKIFGPGNQYVTCAKQLVQQQGIAIDMPAGPSEVCVLADETANAAFVAADLLSQAEHGIDSQVLLVSTQEALVQQVQQQIAAQLQQLPRQDIAQKALENSTAIVVGSMEEAIELVNEYAAEHLIISCKNEDAISDQIINAGSVFLGNYSPESAGDYASGTNHTLPTNGFAKAYSGVSVDSFVKKITYQKLTTEGIQNIGNAVIQMAEAEGLQAHANAVKVRLQNL